MKPSLLSFALFGAMASFSVDATTNPPSSPAPVLSWGRCTLGTGTSLDPDLFARIDCGWIQVPHDRGAVSSPQVRLPVLRVRAAKPERYEGTVFYHPGGPGVDPMSYLLSMAKHWNAVDITDPNFGDLRRLAERYDIIAVTPRGLTDDTRPECVAFTGENASQALLAPDDDEAWRTLVADTRAFAHSCGPKAALIHTEAQVEDIEAVRAAMGLSTAHFYATSYGTWVATWYAATHPAHTGRLLLDASVDFQRRWLFQQAGLHIYRERALIADALKPASERPEVYGLGTSSPAIRQRLIGMPLFMRRLWAPAISFPEHVVAALAIADEWQAMPQDQRSFDALRNRLMRHAFHKQDDIDREMRKDAFALAGALFQDNESPRPVPYGGTAAMFAVYCNDSIWRTSPDEIRRGVRFMDTQVALPRGNDAVMSLICAAWPHVAHPRPSFDVLKRLPSIMLMHASSDWATPMGAAEAIAEQLPNSHLLITRGLQGHNSLGQPMAACATRHAAHYLLTGETPTTSRTECVLGEPGDASTHPAHQEL